MALEGFKSPRAVRRSIVTVEIPKASAASLLESASLGMDGVVLADVFIEAIVRLNEPIFYGRHDCIDVPSPSTSFRADTEIDTITDLPKAIKAPQVNITLSVAKE